MFPLKPWQTVKNTLAAWGVKLGTLSLGSALQKGFAGWRWGVQRLEENAVISYFPSLADILLRIKSKKEMDLYYLEFFMFIATWHTLGENFQDFSLCWLHLTFSTTLINEVSAMSFQMALACVRLSPAPALVFPCVSRLHFFLLSSMGTSTSYFSAPHWFVHLGCSEAISLLP